MRKIIKRYKLLKKMLYFLLFLSVPMLLIYGLNQLIPENLTPSVNINYIQNYGQNGIVYYLPIVVFVPIIEELLYRFGLKFSVNKTSFLILGALYTVYLPFQPLNIDWRNPSILLLFFGGMVLAFFLIKIIVNLYKTKVKKLYTTYPKYIFGISVLIFAYSHITLFPDYKEIHFLLLSPLILRAYIIAGIIYGIIRIKLGFFWAISGHILWNLLSTIINATGG